MSLGRIIAVANQKGGVGKTTTAVNVAVALARSGRRVLLVDFDPQANATGSLGVYGAQVQSHVYDVLSGMVPLRDAVLRLGQTGLHLLPAHPDLAGAEVELATMENRLFVLREALTDGDVDVEVTIIDCPPSLSVLTLNAFVAARDGLLIPVQCEYLALEGLSRLMHTVESVRAGVNPALTVVGIVMTMYDVRTNLSAEVVQEVRGHFPGLVFREAVPRSVRLSEAPSRGMSVIDYAPNSAGALAYRAVAQELAERLRLPRGNDCD